MRSDYTGIPSSALSPGVAPLTRRATGHSRAALAALVLGVAALSGCAVVPAGPAGAYYGDGEYIAGAGVPPAPYVEAIPVAPFVGAVWVGGFWDWSGGRHVWRPGHYEHPRPGFTYRQPGWHVAPGGRWMLHRGGWEGPHR